ncbi:MAG: glycosyltransferase family 2 protein [Terriglobia bacterium]|jgi:glycosyltransferase involved in cell wall biosynthesis
MPKVLASIVMATLNEEEYIERCMLSLLSQRDVPGEYEVLVFDSGSEDRTLAILQDIAKRDSRVRLLKNPERVQVHAYNLGLKEARGQYIAVVGAHAEYDCDYLTTCLHLLNTTGATNVGGVQNPVGKGPVGQAIAWAMSSPLGVGGEAKYYAKREEFIDNVFGFFCRKSALEVLGGFDEKYVSGEDFELNYRARRAGGGVLVSPRIRLKYFVRSSLRALAGQLFRNGYGRAQTHGNCHGSFRKWHSLPPLLVAATLASLAWLLIKPGWPALIVPLAYSLFALAGGLISFCDTRSLKVAILAPFVLATMHYAWGLGWWLGVRRFGFPKVTQSGPRGSRVQKEAVKSRP